MDSVKFAVILVFALGFIGCISALPIAAFPQSTLRSKSKTARFFAKSSIFSLHFFFSFVLTATPLAWIMEAADIPIPNPERMTWIYLIACIPLAIVLYRIHMAVVSAIYSRTG